LGEKPPLEVGEEGAGAVAEFFAREAVGAAMRKSAKFVKCMSSAVQAFGPSGFLNPHKAKLRRAAEQTTTFVTKMALQKIDKL
jgi:hypothetical protein